MRRSVVISVAATVLILTGSSHGADVDQELVKSARQRFDEISAPKSN